MTRTSSLILLASIGLASSTGKTNGAFTMAQCKSLEESVLGISVETVTTEQQINDFQAMIDAFDAAKSEYANSLENHGKVKIVFWETVEKLYSEGGRIAIKRAVCEKNLDYLNKIVEKLTGYDNKLAKKFVELARIICNEDDPIWDTTQYGIRIYVQTENTLLAFKKENGFSFKKQRFHQYVCKQVNQFFEDIGDYRLYKLIHFVKKSNATLIEKRVTILRNFLKKFANLDCPDFQGFQSGILDFLENHDSQVYESLKEKLG